MFANKVFKDLLDFLLPAICPGCDNSLADNENTICKTCLDSILKVDATDIPFEFDRMFAISGIIEDLFAPYYFDKDSVFQRIIHKLKYRHRYQIGMFLGALMGEEIKLRKPDWIIDYIVPIPLHRIRESERGFNQSHYIAKGLWQGLGNPTILIKKNLVKRKIYNETQTTRDFRQRALNVTGIFAIKWKNFPVGKNVLIVDDIITTGATTLECAKKLHNAGCGKIYIASAGLAHKEFSNNDQ